MIVHWGVWMQVEALNHPKAFDELREEWQALVPMSQANLIFSTWEWHRTWWQAYCPGTLWMMTVRDDEGALVGLMPLFIAEGQVRMAHLVGGDDVTDYLDIIAHRDHTGIVYAALAAYLAGSVQFEEVSLSNIREESPTRTVFAAALEAQGFMVTLTPLEVCPLFAVPETFEEYLNLLDSKQKSELRRKLRRAEGAEDMGWYIVDATHDLNAQLDLFLELMASSHPDKAAFLRNPQHMAFFRTFMPIAMERGWLQLAFQTYENEAIAAYLNFDYNGDILIYNSGLRPDRYGALSPGIVLLVNLIQWAIEHRRRTFNFLRGSEPYKYHMGGRDTTVYRLQATRDQGQPA